MGFECILNNTRKRNELSYYDIEVVSHNFKIEVKDDVRSAKSGNAAIEFWNSKSNKPSGLTITKSDIWCHIMVGEPYVIRTEVLRKFVDTVKPKSIKTGVGDGNADIMLYDVEILKAAMVHIDNIKDLL